MKSLARAVFHRLPAPLQDRVRAQLAWWRLARGRRVFTRAGVPAFEQNHFNETLHYLRGRELDKLPKGAADFLSVGCAGTWYFKWIEEHCGPIGRHVGIEFYSPKPDDLPANVEWIANTAGNMSGIASASADVLFSGQKSNTCGSTTSRASCSRATGCFALAACWLSTAPTAS